ncbi:RapZ C-terminal domain-containing protein [Streptomyces agglomeratus]|uniref:RapZ C-terminal domain-containing protein n=1 Tax=Streptomyces agglomeratus TaxID=285458 RepID=UPI00210B9635|nr:hypothetical protein [Streptomyces agglomeratus]
MPPIRLISFGYLHLPTGPDGSPVPPAADRIEDVRDRLRDPAAARDILDLDGFHPRVQDVVLGTPGARELLSNLTDYAARAASPQGMRPHRTPCPRTSRPQPRGRSRAPPRPPSARPQDARQHPSRPPRTGPQPMKPPSFRRCGHAPGTLTSEDQAVVDQFRAMLTAVRNPEPWTPGLAQDIAVRVGPFIERAHLRPGDDHGPVTITVALRHPDDGGPLGTVDDLVAQELSTDPTHET